MSNNVKLQVLLRAVDQASRPFKSIRTASKSLSGDIRETQKSLRELNGQASRITAPAGRSYVDQSKNEYHISLTGGTAPGTQLDRQLQDALEKYERDKRARARASMMHDG